MRKGKSSGQATNLTDPALALAVYGYAPMSRTLWCRVRDLSRLLTIGTLRCGRRVQRVKVGLLADMIARLQLTAAETK
jgi:hypothetical protein